MSVRTVLRMGNPFLRQVALPVDPKEILGSEFQEMLDDMLETMHAHSGIGLAAPQIGVSKRVALVAVPENSQRYPEAESFPLDFYINPEWKLIGSEKIGIWEGCLSVPGLRGFVERVNHIEISYLDREARPQSLEVQGFPAIVFQHEFDHLDGKLFVDRLESTEKLAFQEEYEQFWMEYE